MVKVIVDNTCIVQFRHPNEEGGIYWSLSMVAAFGVTFGSVYLFEREQEKSMDNDRDLNVDLLWSLTTALAGAWALSFALLLALMVPRYRMTFLSTQTGWQWSQSFFRDGKTDAARIEIFNNSTKQWKNDIGEDVKAWVHENWETWIEEKPEWLTDALKARIPIEYIPIKLDKFEEKKRRESLRRRSSFSGSLISPSN